MNQTVLANSTIRSIGKNKKTQMSYKGLINSLLCVIAATMLSNCNNPNYQKPHLNKSISISAKEKQKEFEKQHEINKQKEIEKQKRDSLIKAQEKIAFNNINFGITKSEFETKRRLFLNTCKGGKEYKIGGYEFRYIYGSFHENKLYSIKFMGRHFSWQDYDLYMPGQYKSLLSMMKIKFGEPTRTYGLPKWNEMRKNDIKYCTQWTIGVKEVTILVRCNGTDYSLYVLIDRKDILSLKIKEKEKEQERANIKGADMF